MFALDVRLPGGLPGEGHVERSAHFRPLTGHLELALTEVDRRVSRPAYVSSVLSLALESIGGRDIDRTSVDALCSADRLFLMMRLGAVLGGEQQWVEVICGQCRQTFDVQYRRCDLPIKEAGSGFPVGRAELRSGIVEFSVPTGSDQLSIAHMADEQAMRHLLFQCIHSVDGAPPAGRFVESLSTEEIDILDTALDELSPAICTELLVACPECKTEQRAMLDHTRLPGLEGGGFYDEVHSLAMHYHWGESEILHLPRDRRRHYLGLIERSRAMIAQVE